MQCDSSNSAGRYQAQMVIGTPGNGRLTHYVVPGLPIDGGRQRAWWPAVPTLLDSMNRPASPRACPYSPLCFGGTIEPSEEGGGDEEGLAELLSTAMSKTASSETEFNNNASTPMELVKLETSDRATPNSLLVTLDDSAKCVADSNKVASSSRVLNGVERLKACTTVGHSDAQDFCIEDAPLVSRRVPCHTQDILVPESTSGTLTTNTPVAQKASCIDLSMPEKQQQSPIVGYGSPFGMQFGSGLSMFGASLVANPKPEEEARVLYVAVFLTKESRDVLLAMVPPVHPLVSADHMTLAYKPSAMQLLDYPLGATVHLNVMGLAADSRAQAVAADPPTWLPPTTSVCSHVTISVAVGAKPMEAGQLIMDALQLAAVTDPSGPTLSGAGVYRHFSEALPLVGTVGVKLLLRSGERVVHSIEELTAGGWLNIGSDEVASFYEKHSAVLGKKTQCSPVSTLDLHASTTASSSGSYSPLTSVQVPPLQLPPPLLPPLGTSAAVGMPDGDNQLAGYASDVAAEQLLNNSAGAFSDDDALSTDTGSSGSDAVQFRSSVHVGDYVALRPFIPSVGGDRIVQGFVREFACEDAFQGNGVMVVLTDNTIGYVTAVLDPASTQDTVAAVPAATMASSSKGGKAKRGKGKGKCTGEKGGKLLAADAAASAAADELNEWALAAHGVAASSSGLSKRTAEVAQRDLQLWTEFDTLQQQYGEALCTAILQDCNQDFVEAIATIKAQFAGFAAGTSAGGEAAGTSAAATAAASQVELEPVLSPTATADAMEAQDDLVQQLALSLGLSADSAVQLCKLVPHVPAESAIEVLQQQGGDVNKAADVLLSAAAASCSVDSPAAASRTTTDRAVAAMASSKDATLVLSANTLCVMFPGMQQDMAELLLKEHGSLDEAARAVSEMQAKELEARTAAAAGTPLSPQLRPTHSSKQREEPQQPSEEDQLAMLAAMGLLNMNEVEAAAADAEALAAPFAKPSVPSTQRTQQTPPRSKSPSKKFPMPTSHMQLPISADDAGSSINSPAARQRQQGGYGSPMRRGHQHRAQHTMPDRDNREAKLAAKAEVDELYNKSKALTTAADVYMAAAQQYLQDGNTEGYLKQKALAEKARADARSALTKANQKSWSANNSSQQSWQIDFHGLTVPEALRKFVQQFELLAALNNPGGVLYKVIVGQGHHSENNEPKIKKGVLQYLEEKASQVLQDTGRPWTVNWLVDPCNPGLITVNIPGKVEGIASTLA